MRPRKICFLFVFWLCLTIGIVFLSSDLKYTVKAAPLASTVTVCASGCDSTSIQSAIDGATDGDTIQLSAEIYTEPININKSITIQGMGDDQTIIQAATSPDTATTRVIAIQSGATVTITGVTIRYGKASGAYGGGIYAFNSNVSIINSTIDYNNANNGGGIYLGDIMCKKPNNLVITDSTISNNTATFGGGIFLTCPTSIITITNCTISGNSATGIDTSYGGGIANTYQATATIHNSTISGNTSKYGGGIYNKDNSIFNLYNSIIANSPSGGDCSNSATINDNGYNLIEDSSCISQSTSKSGDPMLGPLTDNGGPTKTHALNNGSPALEQIAVGINGCGTTITTDQRGENRPGSKNQPTNKCEMGAWEAQSTDPTAIRLQSFTGKSGMGLRYLTIILLALAIGTTVIVIRKEQ